MTAIRLKLEPCNSLPRNAILTLFQNQKRRIMNLLNQM